MSDEKMEAVQAVVDRVAAYQDGATEGTVENELFRKRVIRHAYR